MSVSREEQGFAFVEEEPEEEPVADEEEAVDPLAALEPEVQEHMRALLSEREQATRAQIRTALQEHGLDVTDDGRPALRDAQKLGWLGYTANAPAPATPVAPAPAPEPEEAEVPDPVMNPAEFRRWHEKSLQAAMKPLLETLSRERELSVETAIDIAMAKVPAAINNFAPRFADLLQHPEFEARMRQALGTLQPGQWKDPQNLARVAGMLAIDMDRGQAPVVKAPPRDREGRFASGDVGRAALSRQLLAQSGPSREAGRQSRGAEPSEVDQQIGQALGISAEEAALLRQDTTGDASAQLRKARLDKMRGGRR